MSSVNSEGPLPSLYRPLFWEYTNSPQAAMLGTGAIVKRPRVVVDDNGNESIGVRSICYLPLTYDHRLIDGADAGRFLTTIKRRLEEGAFEADLGL